MEILQSIKTAIGDFVDKHLVSDFPDELPPFCFDCNEGSCEGCSAHQAYLRDKDAGWKEWDEKKLDKWKM